MDLIVRTPQYVAWGLQEGDWFLREIVSQGKVLYEKRRQGRGCEKPKTIIKQREGCSRQKPSSMTKSASTVRPRRASIVRPSLLSPAG